MQHTPAQMLNELASRTGHQTHRGDERHTRTSAPLAKAQRDQLCAKAGSSGTGAIAAAAAAAAPIGLHLLQLWRDYLPSFAHDARQLPCMLGILRAQSEHICMTCGQCPARRLAEICSYALHDALVP